MAGSNENASSMAPGFLVASPKLDGSAFERAVILLVHHDEQGAMGHIINKPIDVDFGTLLTSVNEDLEEAILPERYDRTVYFGGPVRMEQLWVLFDHADPTREAGWAEAGFAEPANLEVGDAWTLSASGRVIESFALNDTDDYFMPVLGYAGWGAGQLEGELEDGSWLIADFDDALICQTPPQECWDRALAQIGVAPAAFLMMGKVGSA